MFTNRPNARGVRGIPFPGFPHILIVSIQFQKIIRNSTNSGYSGQHLVFKTQRNKTSWAELCQAQGKLRLVGLRIDLCLLWVTNMFLFLPIWIRISILAIYSAAFGRIGMVILCSYVWFPVFGLKARYIKILILFPIFQRMAKILE